MTNERDSARRALAELSRIFDEPDTRTARASELAAWRARVAVALLVVAGGLFVAGWMLLTMSTSRDGVGCGTALSNSGWHDSHRCHDAVEAAGLWGWTFVLAGVAIALGAASVRWGAEWWSRHAPVYARGR